MNTVGATHYLVDGAQMSAIINTEDIDGVTVTVQLTANITYMLINANKASLHCAGGFFFA